MNATTLRTAVTRALGHVVVVVLAGMVANVTWQVISRYVLGAPSPYTEELARFLLVWLGLLGGAYAAAFDDHIALDLVPLSERTKRWVRTLSMVLLGLILTVGGAWLVRFTLQLEQRSAALQLPLAWVYLAAPLAGGLIIFFALTSAPRDQEPAP